MKEIDEAKKGIAEVIEHSNPSCGLKMECNTECGKCGTERILSLRGKNWRIAVVRKEGKLPIRDNPQHIERLIDNDLQEAYADGYKKAQQDMLNDRWVQEVIE